MNLGSVPVFSGIKNHTYKGKMEEKVRRNCTFLFAKTYTLLITKTCAFLIAKSCTLLFTDYNNMNQPTN